MKILRNIIAAGALTLIPSAAQAQSLEDKLTDFSAEYGATPTVTIGYLRESAEKLGIATEVRDLEEKGLDAYVAGLHLSAGDANSLVDPFIGLAVALDPLDLKTETARIDALVAIETARSGMTSTDPVEQERYTQGALAILFEATRKDLTPTVPLPVGAPGVAGTPPPVSTTPPGAVPSTAAPPVPGITVFPTTGVATSTIPGSLSGPTADIADDLAEFGRALDRMTEYMRGGTSTITTHPDFAPIYADPAGYRSGSVPLRGNVLSLNATQTNTLVAFNDEAFQVLDKVDRNSDAFRTELGTRVDTYAARLVAEGGYTGTDADQKRVEYQALLVSEVRENAGAIRTYESREYTRLEASLLENGVTADEFNGMRSVPGTSFSTLYQQHGTDTIALAAQVNVPTLTTLARTMTDTTVSRDSKFERAEYAITQAKQVRGITDDQKEALIEAIKYTTAVGTQQ